MTADEPKEGWLGVPCPYCDGTGQVYKEYLDNEGACSKCGGTGEAYGPIVTIPKKEDAP